MSISTMSQAAMWAVGSGALSLLISAMFMRFVLGLSFRDTVKEIEEDQNLAVAAFFAFFVVVVNLFMGAVASDGFSANNDALHIDLAWVIFGFLTPAALSVVTSAAVIRYGGTRQPGESLFQYIRRELVTEDNAALAVLIISLSLMWFIPFWFQII